MKEIKLKRKLECKTKLVKLGEKPHFEKYKGYCTNIEGLEFDIFKTKMFGWQLNYKGVMVYHFDKLNELKEALIERGQLMENAIEFIKANEYRFEEDI